MNKLKRSKSNRVLAGVCGGIGEYFNMDPVIVRVIWLVLTFAPGAPGLLAYIICTLIIPEDDGVIYEDNNQRHQSHSNLPIIIGVALIVIGALKLLDIMFPKFYHMLRMFNVLKYWPVLLIIGGIYIIVKQRNK